MYDFHLHSNFSFDSSADPERIVQEAIRRGIQILCFTDHLDFDSNLAHKDYEFDIEEYFITLQALQKKYAGQLDLRIGCEFGLQPHLIQKYQKIAKSWSFDFIILSIHTVEHQDLYSDHFTVIHEPLDAIQRCYRETLECIKYYDEFDVLGHLDYIDRYFDRRKKMPKFCEYRPIVDKIFKTLIEKGKGIELNSAGLRKELGYFHPKPEALQRYFELGGSIVTFGSDAHIETDLGKDYEQVITQAKQLGMKKLSLFKNRKRENIEI